MGIYANRWLKKPSWGDFIAIVVIWATFMGISIFGVISECSSIWLTVLIVVFLLLFYVAIIVSSYRHVKEYKNKFNSGNSMQKKNEN